MGTRDRKHIKNELKRLFKGYRTMTAPIRRGLHRLGFDVVDGKTHYKVFFRNFPYPIVISKTPSDYRSGLNFVRDAMNMVDFASNSQGTGIKGGRCPFAPLSVQ